MFRTIKTILVNQGQLNSVNIKALFTLGFLDKDHISVYTGYQDDEWYLPTGATKEHTLLSVQWTSSNTALINVPLGVTEVKIRRKVPKDIIYTNFEGNAALTRKNLNDAQRQALQILEEIDDNLYTYNQVGGGDSGEITIPYATETQRGIIEIATSQEVSDGLDDERAVTPLKLKNFVNGRISDLIESFGFYTSTGVISGLEVTKVNVDTINISAGTSFIVDPITNTKNYYLSAERTITLTQFDLIGIKYVKAVLTDGGLDIQLSVTPNLVSGDYRSIILGVIYPMQANVVDRGIAEIVDLRKYATQTNNMVYELAYKPVVESFSLSLVGESLVVNNGGLIVGRAVNGKNPEELRETLVTYVTNATSRHMCQNVLSLIDNGFDNIWHTDISAFKSLMTDNKYYWLDVALDGKMNIIVAYNPAPYDTLDLAYSNATNSYIDKATRVVTHKILVSKVGSAYTYSKLFKCTVTGDIIREAEDAVAPPEPEAFSISQMPIGTVLEGTPEMFDEKWALCDGKSVSTSTYNSLAVLRPAMVSKAVTGITKDSEDYEVNMYTHNAGNTSTQLTAVQSKYYRKGNLLYCLTSRSLDSDGMGKFSTSGGAVRGGLMTYLTTLNLTNNVVSNIGYLSRMAFPDTPVSYDTIENLYQGRQIVTAGGFMWVYGSGSLHQIDYLNPRVDNLGRSAIKTRTLDLNFENFYGNHIVEMVNVNDELYIIFQNTASSTSHNITITKWNGINLPAQSETVNDANYYFNQITKFNGVVMNGAETVTTVADDVNCYNYVDNAFYILALGTMENYLSGTANAVTISQNAYCIYKVAQVEGVWTRTIEKTFRRLSGSSSPHTSIVKCRGKDIFIYHADTLQTVQYMSRLNGVWSIKVLNTTPYYGGDWNASAVTGNLGMIPNLVFVDKSNIINHQLKTSASTGHDYLLPTEANNFYNKVIMYRNINSGVQDGTFIGATDLRDNGAFFYTNSRKYSIFYYETEAGIGWLYCIQNYITVPENVSGHSVRFRRMLVTKSDIINLPNYETDDISGGVAKFIKVRN